jgi:hypothetical protein
VIFIHIFKERDMAENNINSIITDQFLNDILEINKVILCKQLDELNVEKSRIGLIKTVRIRDNKPIIKIIIKNSLH